MNFLRTQIRGVNWKHFENLSGAGDRRLGYVRRLRDHHVRARRHNLHQVTEVIQVQFDLVF